MKTCKVCMCEKSLGHFELLHSAKGVSCYRHVCKKCRNRAEYLNSKKTREEREASVSKSWVTKTYGLNASSVDELILRGVLSTTNGKVLRASLASLVEGSHYVVCRACGRFQGQISTKHLTYCSKSNLDSYLRSYPEAQIMSEIVSGNRVRSEEQRQAQSEKLIARFQTPEGESTRIQISVAAKQLHEGGYREQAVAHLRMLGKSPEVRLARAVASKQRWASEEFRERMRVWRDNNREQVLARAAHARKNTKRKRTRPHLSLKAALVAAGWSEFVTEFEIGYFSIDEALPRLKLAVEMDGCYWHGCEECGFPGFGETATYDKRKTTYLTNLGWSILRVKEHEVKASLSECVDRIVAFIKNLD